MDRANDVLVVEILDILLGFAICTNPIWIAKLCDRAPCVKKSLEEAWIANLREALQAELPRFRALESSQHEDIASVATNILAELA